MPYWTLERMDGRYSLGFPVSDEDGPEREKRGEAVFFGEPFMKAHETFATMDAVFQDYFRMLDNQSYLRRREDELRDVPDSERMGLERRIQTLEHQVRELQTTVTIERRLKEEAQHDLFELEMRQSTEDRE